LPRSDAERPGDEVAVCDLVEPSLRRDVTIAMRAERRPSPAAEAFLDVALAAYGRGAPPVPAPAPGEAASAGAALPAAASGEAAPPARAEAGPRPD